MGGGANASTSAGIATPGGAIPGAEGGGANALCCAAWCHRSSRCGAWVSPSPSLRRVWCYDRCRRTARGVAGTVVGRSVRRVVVAVAGLRRMCVTVAVGAARVVSRAPSLRRVWCHGRRLCAACGGAAGAVVAPRVVLRALPSGCVSVTVAVFAPRVVSGVPPLRRVWRCGRCHRAARGVCSREGHGDVARRRGARDWEGRDDDARAVARGAATGRARLGGVRRRGTRDWDGCDDEARAAARGAAMGRATARWGHVSVVAVGSGAW